MMSYFDENFIRFFKELSQNNTREWFDTNRKAYEKDVKKPFVSFTEILIQLAQSVYPDIQITPGEAILNIHRDIRFSPDKTPYNTYKAAIISAKGRKDKSYPGYYIQLSHENVSVFGGAYMPDKVSLKKVREAIAQNPKAFAGIYNDKIYKEKFGSILGEKHKRIPKEFQEAAQSEPLIANKQFYFKADLKPEIILKDDLAEQIYSYFKAGKKLNDFLIQAIYG